MIFFACLYARYYLACIVCLLCLCCAVFAQVPTSRHGRKPPVTGPQRHGRDTLVIDGEWKFHTDPNDTGQANKWDHSMPEGATKTTVPSLWTTQAAPGYTGVAWYWREFDAPTDWQGQTIRLRFDGAAETATVWVNGTQAGDHTGGVTPFEFDVTKTVHVGAKNLVAVRLAGNGKVGAGLWQGVQLMAHDEAYIANCFPQSDLYGHLSVAIIFRNASTNSGDATLDARVVAADAPTRDVQKSNQILHLTPGKNETNLLISVPSKQLHLWSPETPYLYRLQLAFRQNLDILDTQETTLGCRTLGVQNGAVTLNGTAIKLAAIAPELDYPVVIATTDDEQRVRDLLHKLKSQGVNLIYLEAPPSALLRLADQEGMLVIEGARRGTLDIARANELEGLIVRDRAHASIIGWWPGDIAEEQIHPLRRLDSTRFLLTGPLSAPHLWLPGQDTPSDDPLPAGLLPQR
jgi:beta-galactosidase